MINALDITGLWSGEYRYPKSWRAPVGFTAILSDQSGAITGSISERSDIIAGGYEQADVLGTRHGAEVSFTKIYDDSGAYGHAVAYRGAMNAAGTDVTGTWTLEGLSGTFHMWRQISDVAAEERRESIVIGVSGGTAP